MGGANSGDRAHSFSLSFSGPERGQKCEGSVSLVSRFIEMGDQLNFIYPKSFYRYKFWISLNQLSDNYTCKEIL